MKLKNDFNDLKLAYVHFDIEIDFVKNGHILNLDLETLITFKKKLNLIVFEV